MALGYVTDALHHIFLVHSPLSHARMTFPGLLELGGPRDQFWPMTANGINTAHFWVVAGNCRQYESFQSFLSLCPIGWQHSIQWLL